MKKIILVIFFFISAISFGQNNSLLNLTQYVNPFIGTGGHGHTYPGATVPFGMVQLSPDTRLDGWDGCSGYHYTDSIIYGFSHMHLSGTGVPDYCDILFMPANYDLFNQLEDLYSIKSYTSSFDKKNENAEPGYYSVILNNGNIKVDLTTTKRAGFHKYSFEGGGTPRVVIDLKHRYEVLESDIKIISSTEIEGYRRSKYWAKDKRVYFYAKFSKPIKNYYIFQDDKFGQNINEATGKNLKTVLEFDEVNNEPLFVKVGISAVSKAGAKLNVDTEIPNWNFDGIKEQAKEDWNKELNKIQVEGGTKDRKIVFYTALYHTMVVPNIYMDVDGQFRGTDLQVHKAEGFENYTVFSLWDTYRAEHPLMTIIDQKRTKDYINTFLKMYEYRGLLPVWELSANETYCMIGYHSVPVIVDAYIKGIQGFDEQLALKAMKHSADTSLFGLEYYRQYGFVPQDREHESVSKTLEYAYDDWCIAQFAKTINEDDYYKTFIERAQSYKNVFDASTGMMRAKVNGGWYKPFDPLEVNSNYTEANSWQYSFYVPQDMTGFIKLHGGKDKLAGKLDELFITESKMSGLDLSDITGLIGQYAHGNEPSHHMAYLYDYINQPWKTQALIHKINTEFYKNDPDGLIGNEDCGQMSAWFVLSAMGFYQVCPGQLQYAIGTPLFDKVTINLENGNRFIIKAENLSDKNYYIQSARLYDSKYSKCYLDHSNIMAGGEIVFQMGSEPNKDWGSEDKDVPQTEIKDNLIVPVPVIDAEKKSFSTSQKIEILSINSDDKIYFTTNGREPNTNSTPYSSSFKIDQSITIKAIAINSDSKASKIVSAQFFKVPESRSIKIISQYSKQYTGGGDEALIDLERGDRNWRLGKWQGYKGQDFEAIVDLWKVRYIKEIKAGFLQDVQSWICFPTEVEFEISSDGINFTSVGVVNTNMNIESKEVEIKDFEIGINKEARYIRVKAKSYGKLPQWHPGAGDPSWIFIDEITIQ